MYSTQPLLNPLSPNSDQHQFFSSIINALSREEEEWRMVKSETRQDAEILVRNPSPRLFGTKFPRLKKSKNKPWKNETSRLIKNASEILRSYQNFPRPTFFEIPFVTRKKIWEVIKWSPKEKCSDLLSKSSH